MTATRRNFLKGTAGLGASAMAAGCTSGPFGFLDCTSGAPMHGFRAPAIPHIRLGVVGMGSRGCGVVGRVCNLPGITVAAICDNVPEKIGKAQKMLSDKGKPPAKEYLGDEAWRRLCDDPDIDVVYNTTPWSLHVPVQLAAMHGGKHVFTEVPSAFTVDECWELVETSERTKRHCMQLENCCYGEIEMLTFNLAKLGMLGEIVHAEGAYIHDLRHMCTTEWPGCECWRYAENRDHGGNRYPTHGLVPLCLTMDINRGDRLDYLVSLESDPAGFEEYATAKYPHGDWRADARIEMGDMNTTLVKTAGGRSIMIQHGVATPRPYDRLNTLVGTRGILTDYPFRVGWEDAPGKGVHKYFDDERTAAVREEFMHPLWRQAGKLAQEIGGHDGMDLIMDLRWAYCLQNGLPLDQDVYDLAAWCSLGELTEKSVRSGSTPQKIPDFTRGAWERREALGILSLDPAKMDTGAIRPLA